jgi:hypothetical protein
VLPERLSQVRFEVSPEAAAVIRNRGGQLWIWPSPDQSAYATTEPPGEAHEWTTYRQAGFVVHVDDAIVPPERWVIAPPTTGSRHLLARWIGSGTQEEVGRLPLVVTPEEEPEPSGGPGWYDRVFLGPMSASAGAWLLASVLGIVGIRLGRFERESLWEGLFIAFALLALSVRWVWLRIRRVDASAPSSGG